MSGNGQPIDRQADVAIVGAGAAGLNAARELKRAGKKIVVIEARNRVGGRTESKVLPNGMTIDVGGQWVAPTQYRVHQLIEEFGLTISPTYDEGLSVLWLDGKRSTYTGVLPELEPVVNAELAQAFAKLDAIVASVPVDAPWTAPDAAMLDAKTFYGWTRETVQSDFARYVLDSLATAAMSSDPSDLSMLHVAFYFASAGGVDVLTGTAGGGQDSRFVEGFQAISKGLAKEVADDIIFESPVRRIVQDDNGVTVYSDKGVVRAKHVVVALSPMLAGRIAYEPALPAMRDQLMQRMPMGTAIKMMAVYDRPFWRDEGLSGLVFSDTALGLTYDNSPEDGSCGILLGFMEGRPGRIWGAKTPAEREEEVIASFERYFGPEARNYTYYVEKYWADEEWSRGCYAGVMPPGGWTGFGAELRKPSGRIHWAGCETATEWMGYVEGALQSGERVASEILAAQ